MRDGLKNLVEGGLCFLLTLILGSLISSSLCKIYILNNIQGIGITVFASSFLAACLAHRVGLVRAIASGVLAISLLSSPIVPIIETKESIVKLSLLLCVFIGINIRQLMPLILTAVLGLIVGLVLKDWRMAALAPILIIISSLISAAAVFLVHNLPFPFLGLRHELPYLVAFGFGYLCTIFLFALIYHNLYLAKGDAAFANIPAGTSPPGLIYFLFVSINVISTTGSPIAPSGAAAKFFICLELLASVLWIAIYFGLLMCRLGKSAGLTKEIQNEGS